MKFNDYLNEHDEIINPLNESFLKIAGGLIDKASKKLYDKALQLLAKKFVNRYPEYKELSDEVESDLKNSKGRLSTRARREYSVKLGRLKKKAEADKSMPDNAIDSLFNPIQDMINSRGLKDIRKKFTSLSALNRMLDKVS